MVNLIMNGSPAGNPIEGLLFLLIAMFSSSLTIAVRQGHSAKMRRLGVVI